MQVNVIRRRDRIREGLERGRMLMTEAEAEQRSASLCPAGLGSDTETDFHTKRDSSQVRGTAVYSAPAACHSHHSNSIPSLILIKLTDRL